MKLERPPRWSDVAPDIAARIPTNKANATIRRVAYRIRRVDATLHAMEVEAALRRAERERERR